MDIEFDAPDRYNRTFCTAKLLILDRCKRSDLMSDRGNVWTDERLDELKKLWAEGLSISQIGEALGVSRNAIAGKAHRMGLPKRPSPISKSKTEKAEPLIAEEKGFAIAS